MEIGLLRSGVMAVVALLLMSPVVGAATVADQPSDLRFESADTVAARGDIATISLQVDPGSTTLIGIHAATSNYGVQTAISDRNQDGRVALQMNTHLAGTTVDPAKAYMAPGGDQLKYVTRVGGHQSSSLSTGRYNVIASNEETAIAAQLRLVNGSVTDGEFYIAAGAASSSRSTLLPEDAALAPRHEVALGDQAVARFNVSGVGALINNPPSENVVVPADSTPGKLTTHTVAVRAPEDTTLQTVTIDYNNGDGGVPPQVLAGTVSTVSVLGVDTQDDGIIDQQLEATGQDITVSSRIDGTVTLTFETASQLQANETLYLRIPMTNPSITGKDQVSVAVNGEPVTPSGEVVYGPSGAGTLGYGVDLQLTAPNMTVANPIAGVDYRYDNDTNTLVVAASTEDFELGRGYSVDLRLLDEYPYGNASSASVDFQVARPQARIDEKIVNGSNGTRSIRVTGQTNLAPSREVGIAIETANGSGGTAFTHVRAHQRINDTVTVPDQIASQEAIVYITYRGQPISNQIQVTIA